MRPGGLDGTAGGTVPLVYAADRFGNANKACSFANDPDPNASFIDPPSFSLDAGAGFTVSFWMKTGSVINEYPIYSFRIYDRALTASEVEQLRQYP